MAKEEHSKHAYGEHPSRQNENHSSCQHSPEKNECSSDEAKGCCGRRDGGCIVHSFGRTRYTFRVPSRTIFLSPKSSEQISGVLSDFVPQHENDGGNHDKSNPHSDAKNT